MKTCSNHELVKRVRLHSKSCSNVVIELNTLNGHPARYLQWICVQSWTLKAKLSTAIPQAKRSLIHGKNWKLAIETDTKLEVFANPVTDVIKILFHISPQQVFLKKTLETAKSQSRRLHDHKVKAFSRRRYENRFNVLMLSPRATTWLVCVLLHQTQTYKILFVTNVCNWGYFTRKKNWNQRYFSQLYLRCGECSNRA